MKQTLFSLAILATAFASCSKKDAAVTATSSNIVGTYKVTAITYAGVNVFNNSNETFNIMQPCERDDLTKFNANGTVDLIDAGTVCNPTSADSGTWSLVNSTTLNIDGDNLTIASFNGTTLVLTDNSQGVEARTTLVKQ